MLNTLYQKLVALHKYRPFSFLPLNFYKFFITGFTAFMIDNTVLNIFILFVFDGEDKRFLDKISIAKIIASFIALIFAFYINRNWSFRAADKTKMRKQIIKYLSVYAINTLIAGLIFPIYKDSMHFLEPEIRTTLANIVTTSNIMVISYFAYRFYVFK